MGTIKKSRNEYYRNYYKCNKEKRKAYFKKYYEEHKDEIKAHNNDR